MHRFHYQYDYLPLLALLVVYLPVSAYSNGIACSTGIVIPCLLNGALIGRVFGLLLTDLVGRHGDEPAWAWVDPGAFALLGAAGESSTLVQTQRPKKRKRMVCFMAHRFERLPFGAL